METTDAKLRPSEAAQFTPQAFNATETRRAQTPNLPPAAVVIMITAVDLLIIMIIIVYNSNSNSNSNSNITSNGNVNTNTVS